MSSLLQHTGRVDRHKGVELILRLIRKEVVDTTDYESPLALCKHCDYSRYYHQGQPLPDLYNDNGKKNDPSFIKGFLKMQMKNPCQFEFKIYGYEKQVDVETIMLPYKGALKQFPKLYRIWRKPQGMFGNWVIFRWNNEDHVPDLSVTISVEKLPRDAEALTEAEMIIYWGIEI